MARTVLNLNRSQLIILSILRPASHRYWPQSCPDSFPSHLSDQSAVDKLTENDFFYRPGSGTPGRARDSCPNPSGSCGWPFTAAGCPAPEVIANVSHELRSPLALITGYAEMVRDITWKDDELRNENLNLIISESNRMSEMVNDILDYSQFSAGYSSLRRNGAIYGIS